MLYTAVTLCLSFLLLSRPLCAAEISNLTTHLTGTHMTIAYDLIGKIGETDSGVEVLMDINGIRYSSNMLSLSGDFGSMIPVGKQRTINWRHPQDFPEGLNKTFKCIVNAVPNSRVINESSAPSEGFRIVRYAVNKQTVMETQTRLMWTRNGNIHVKPMNHNDAENLIKKLNKERYGGYKDWRIPTREDFEGLVFFGKKAGWGTAFEHYLADYLTTCGFDRVQTGNYWTSTASEKGPDQVFVANTWNGIIRPLAKANYYYIWPVRTPR
jgi:hypothetical protein